MFLFGCVRRVIRIISSAALQAYNLVFKEKKNFNSAIELIVFKIVSNIYIFQRIQSVHFKESKSGNSNKTKLNNSPFEVQLTSNSLSFPSNLLFISCLYYYCWSTFTILYQIINITRTNSDFKKSSEVTLQTFSLKNHVIDSVQSIKFRPSRDPLYFMDVDLDLQQEEELLNPSDDQHPLVNLNTPDHINVLASEGLDTPTNS